MVAQLWVKTSELYAFMVCELYLQMRACMRMMAKYKATFLWLTTAPASQESPPSEVLVPLGPRALRAGWSSTEVAKSDDHGDEGGLSYNDWQPRRLRETDTGSKLCDNQEPQTLREAGRASLGS
jgi:hypothetical protein